MAAGIDKQLSERIDRWLEQVKQEYVNDVLGAVAVPSVATYNDGSGYPFGKGCADMLDYMQRITQKYGFPFENHQYYCASSLIPGSEGRGEIGMFGHTDVVPAGDGWMYEPFSPVVKDGYIIGRGSNDNKGSTFACLYAMRFLQEQGIRLKSNVRLYFGCCEEDGMDDVKYYGRTVGYPDVTIVPDSWFPISCSEKGAAYITVSAEVDDQVLADFQAGDTEITIPERARCTLKGVTLTEVQQKLAGKEQISATAVDGGVQVVGTGVSKHVCFPEGSVNAVAVLAHALVDCGLVQGKTKEVLSFLASTVDHYDGSILGLKYHDDFAGDFVHALGMAYQEGNQLVMSFNMHYPAVKELDGSDQAKRFFAYFDKPFLTRRSTREVPEHIVDINHPVVDILCRVSSEVYGFPLKPFAQAGGTYAYYIPNSFAAGPAMHTREQQLFGLGHGGAHQPDECMEIDVLLHGIKIYILALLQIDDWLSQQNRS